MDNNQYYYGYITKLYNITKDKINDKDLLEIFCEFISSNPYFKYNGTFLRDSIILFSDKLEGFMKKKKIVEDFNNKFSNNYESLSGWHIIIDNFYVITQNFEIKLLLDFKECKYLERFINEFNFSQHDTNYFLIRYLKLRIDEKNYCGCIEREILEKRKIKDIEEYENNKDRIISELFSTLESILIEENYNKRGNEVG